MQQKVAWDLQIEPYMCDNSRLLAESNTLHMDIIKQRDQFRMRIVDLKRNVNTLEVDKRHLEEHSTELSNKIRELESRLHESKAGSGKHKAPDTAGKKPFISTVRTGEFLTTPIAPVSSPDLRCCRCCKCSSSSTTGSNLWKADLQHCQIENRTMTDTIDELNKQVRFWLAS